MADQPEKKDLLDVNKNQNEDTSVRKPQSPWNWVTVILLLLNLVLLAITVSVVVIWRTSNYTRVTQHRADLKDHLCLPCKDISLHVDDDNDNFKDFNTNEAEDGTILCCAEGGRHLDRLIEMFVERRYREDKANQRFCSHGASMVSQNEKPAARVVGLIHNSINNVDRIIRWDENSDKSFQQRIVYGSDGRFLIPSDGYYYVYTQVTFKEEDGATVSDVNSGSLISHQVYKRNKALSDTIEEKILENFESRCQLQASQSNTTSYVGAVFRLSEGDEIFVRVSHPQRINESPHGNYFGVHLI